MTSLQSQLPQTHVPATPKIPTIKTALITIGAGLLITVVVFGGAVGLLFTLPILQQWMPTVIVTAIAVHACLMLTATLVLLRKNNISLHELGFSRPTWRLLHLLWQIPTTFIAILVTQGIVFLITGTDPGGSNSTETLSTEVSQLFAVLLFVSVAILTPFWEEILFRGMIQGSIRSRYGRVAGVVVSAIIFAAAHGVPILLPYMITLGFSLGLLREFHRNLWGSLAMHCTLNIVASSTILIALL